MLKLKVKTFHLLFYRCFLYHLYCVAAIHYVTVTNRFKSYSLKKYHFETLAHFVTGKSCLISSPSSMTTMESDEIFQVMQNTRCSWIFLISCLLSVVRWCMAFQSCLKCNVDQLWSTYSIVAVLSQKIISCNLRAHIILTLYNALCSIQLSIWTDH